MRNKVKRIISIVLILCCIISAAEAYSFAAGSDEDIDIDMDLIAIRLKLAFDSKLGTNKISIRYDGYKFYADSLNSAVGIVSDIVSGSRTMVYVEFWLETDITETVRVNTNPAFSDVVFNLNGHTWTSPSSGPCIIAFGGYGPDGKVEISDGKMIAAGNGNSNSGGCIYTYEAGLEIDNVAFERANGTIKAGGAIAAFSEPYLGTTKVVNVNKSSFKGFKATSGGAIYCEDGYSANIKNSEFGNCSAQCGGAVYADHAVATFTATTFESCTATGRGGAIALDYSTQAYSYSSGRIELRLGTIIRKCVAEEGGAVAVGGHSSNNITFSGDSRVENCVAGQGGAVAVDMGAVKFSDTACIRNCSAVADSQNGYGGAVYVSQSGRFEMDGNSSISNCTSAAQGSAIYVNGESAVAMLKGDTTVTASANDKYAMLYSARGDIAIFGGEYIGTLLTGSSGRISVSGGWFNKRVSYPAPGYSATADLPGEEHAAAPYTVAEKVITVTFNYNNGTTSSRTYENIPAGKVQMPSCEGILKDSTFKAWAINDVSGEQFSPGEYLDLQENTKFYAVWVPNSNAQRTIRFIDPVSNDTEEKTFTSRTVKIESMSSRFKRTNYHIASFNTNKDGSGNKVLAGNTLDMGDSLFITLYVVWEENMNINDDDGGEVHKVIFQDSIKPSNNPDYVFMSQNDSIQLTDNDFKRSDVVIAGWSTRPEGGTIYQLGDSYTFPAAESVLYAYWVDKSENTYHAGESGQSHAEDIVIVIDPSHSSSGGGGGGESESSTVRTIIYYDSNPQSANAPVTQKTFDSSTAIFAGGFKRQGYTLSGWNTQPNGKGTGYKNGDIYYFGNSKELVLYAMWSVNKNDVTPGESGGASQEVIEAYEEKKDPNPGWTPGKGEGGDINGDVPSNWREEYRDRPYYDVDPSKYYYDAVIWAEEIGAIGGIIGIDSDLFKGDEYCTRADLVTLLWEIAGEPKPKSSKSVFTDVKDGLYYSKAVAWSNEQGIILGVGDNKMDPDGIVTRSQVLTILWRYHGSPASSANFDFKDVVKNSWYEKAVKWGVEKRIALGTSATTFSPDVKCSRAEAVTFLYRDYAGVK